MLRPKINYLNDETSENIDLFYYQFKTIRKDKPRKKNFGVNEESLD